MSFSVHYNSLEADVRGKNVFTPMSSEKLKRRPSQFDRAVHRIYSEPTKIFHNQRADRIFNRTYWAIRALQFKIFYRNEDADELSILNAMMTSELDVDDGLDKWDVGVKPPSLAELTNNTKFNPKWIKYMYTRFKNECPNGRMREPEFRKLLSSIIAPEKATDQYINRLFLAFASGDQKSITFQNLLECLSLLHPESAESNAQWTIRLITGVSGDHFAFPEFLSFTQAVFALNEGKGGLQDDNKETILQRAQTVFRELDTDCDGFVTKQDMITFFTDFESRSQSASTSSGSQFNNNRSCASTTRITGYKHNLY